MAQRVGVRHTFLLILPMTLLLLLGCFLLAGCGAEEVIVSPSSSEPGAAGDEVVVSSATLAEMETGDLEALLTSATAHLVMSLGGDEPAFYATLLALDQGYDTYQLLTGALNERMDSEGHVVDAAGSLLPPAREREGIIEPPPGDAANGAGSVGAHWTSHPTMVASVSLSPAMIAYAERDPADSIATLAADCRLGDVHEMAREMWADQQTDPDKVEPLQLSSEEEAEQLERMLNRAEEWSKRPGFSEELRDALAAAAVMDTTTWHVIALATRGYGVEQIIEAILLDQVSDEWTQLEDTDEWQQCVHITHPSGVILKPKYPPSDILSELLCPGASADAPTGFSPDDIKAAVARLGGSETAPGDEGIPAGTYKGKITDTELATGGLLGPWEVQGTVESNEILIVVAADGSVTGRFSYIKTGNIIMSFESHGATCTQSCDYFYAGEATGQLTSDTGEIVFDIESTAVSRLSEGCATGPKEDAVVTDIRAHFKVEVIDSRMIGTSVPALEDGQPVKGTFTLVKSG